MRLRIALLAALALGCGTTGLVVRGASWVYCAIDNALDPPPKTLGAMSAALFGDAAADAPTDAVE